MALTQEQVTEFETRSTTLTGVLTETADRLRGLREAPEDQRSENWSQDIRTSASTVYALDAELQTVERVLQVEWQRAVREGNRGAGGPGAAFSIPESQEVRSYGQQLTENEEFKGWMQRSKGRGTGPDIEVRALLDSPTQGSNLFLTLGQPTLYTPGLDRRRLFVRDLISTGTTNLSSIPYIVEHLPRTNEEGAQMVAEGAAKPEVVMLFDRADAPVRKIGAWIPATEEILEDAPTLRSYVDARLEYMVMLREEEQFIGGSGTAPELRGIRNQVGLQLQAQVGTGGADIAATLGASIALIEQVDGTPDGIALNPIDFWTMVTTRHANQLDGGYGAVGTPSPFGAPPTTVWGLPAVRSRSMPLTKAIVGAFRMGAQAFDRAGFTIRVGDQHADYFINNKVVILGEKRVAFAVYRPDWFVEATISG